MMLEPMAAFYSYYAHKTRYFQKMMYTYRCRLSPVKLGLGVLRIVKSTEAVGAMSQSTHNGGHVKDLLDAKIFQVAIQFTLRESLETLTLTNC
jgi:hypothetical protein